MLLENLHGFSARLLPIFHLLGTRLRLMAALTKKKRNRKQYWRYFKAEPSLEYLYSRLCGKGKFVFSHDIRFIKNSRDKITSPYTWRSELWWLETHSDKSVLMSDGRVRSFRNLLFRHFGPYVTIDSVGPFSCNFVDSISPWSQEIWFIDWDVFFSKWL